MNPRGRWEYVSLGGGAQRKLRGDANSELFGIAGIETPDIEQTADLTHYAERMLAEREIRKLTGQVVIPWLVRDGAAR